MTSAVSPELELDKASLFYPVRASAAANLLKAAREKRADIGSEIREIAPKQFAVVALKEVSIKLRAGDRIAVIGTNGAGKTTLLRTLAGVYEPDTGARRVVGEVSTIFNLRLGFEMDNTGFENIVLRGLLAGQRRKDVLKQVDEIADSSGLGDYLYLPLRTYSSGMLARLAFTIATAWGASVLLMDEWIGAGDEGFLDMAQKRLVDMVEDVQILVLATHNLAIAQRFCNRAIVMSHGQIRFDGGVEDAIRYFKQHKRRKYGEAEDEAAADETS
jgi:ABC-2 type transport system ATP-binding protein/lipopolysaccharide transport system ATP-binding protein